MITKRDFNFTVVIFVRSIIYQYHTLPYIVIVYTTIVVPAQVGGGTVLKGYRAVI